MRRRWFSIGMAFLLMLLGTGSVAAWQGMEPPRITSFYDAPATIPQEPGSLIRWEPIDNPKGDARLYRLLYTSTDLNGAPIAVSGTLAIPADNPPDGGFPLVASAHGMVGAARNCAPSLALFQELEHQSFWSMQLEPYLTAGYAVVMPDYQGAGAAGPASNVVGIVEAHDVLDAVRAAVVDAPRRRLRVGRVGRLVHVAVGYDDLRPAPGTQVGDRRLRQMEAHRLQESCVQEAPARLQPQVAVKEHVLALDHAPHAHDLVTQQLGNHL